MSDKTVLIVDTQTENIEFIREYILEPNTFKTLNFTNREIVLDAIAAGAVDLLIIDLSLPEMKDFALLKEVRQLDKHLPVIITSPYESTKNSFQAAEMGVKQILLKPFTIEAMLNAIHVNLTETQLRREYEQLSEKFERNQRELNEYEQTLAAFLAVGQLLIETPNPDEALPSLVETAAHLCQTEKGLLLLLDQKGVLRLRAAWGINKSAEVDFIIETNESLAGQVVKTGHPLVVSGQDEYESFKLTTGYFMRSMAITPLKFQGQTVGVLLVGHEKARKSFSRDHLRSLAVLASFAGLAIKANRRIGE
ncbi:MAG TPA: response regulator [Chloroflexi bacterium]|nr:response regulator [Chloroflexota bacterium]